MRKRDSRFRVDGWQLGAIFARAGHEVVFNYARSNNKLKRLARDAQGNALLSESMVEASTGNYVDAQGKLVALLGVKDLIVVDTPDALLIADRRRAQEVGDLVRRLEKAGRDELL